jgi:Cytochrome P460
MKRIDLLLVAVVAVAAVVGHMASVSGQTDKAAAPIFVKEMPPGYRDWRLISVSHEGSNINSIGAVLGNDVATKAYREGKLPSPDGTIIAAVHYKYVASDENNKVFGRAQSFVPGPATNVQFEVKDSKKYAATGGWGFGHFNSDGTAGNDALMTTCFPCHAKASRDLVFTQYAPSYGESQQKK